MRTELFYNPLLLIERIGLAAGRFLRHQSLRGTLASNLHDSQLASKEFFELVKSESIRVMYDVGANQGSWTLLAKTYFPNAEIHAFEPIKKYQDEFVLHTSKISNVHLHRAALGDSNKETHINFAGHSSSFFKIGPVIKRMHPADYESKLEPVSMRTLDAYVQEQNLPFPDLIKLDVEGFELAVLKHGLKTIASCNYLILEVSFIERHITQPLFYEIASFLSQQGYRILAFPFGMPLGQEIISTDVLFSRNLK